MKDMEQGPSGPQVDIAEVEKVATEDTIDHFCWLVATVLRRVLGLSQPKDEGAGTDD